MQDLPYRFTGAILPVLILPGDTYMKRLMIAAALLATSLPAMASNPKPLTLGEQFIVRAYAGQVEGLALSQVIKAKSLGIAVNDSTICVALAGAMAGEFVANNKAEGMKNTSEAPTPRLAMVAFNKPDSAEMAAKEFKNKEAVALVFGGQIDDLTNALNVKMLLASLAKEQYEGALFLHLTVFGKKWVEQAAKEDASIATWLAGKDNIYALGVNAKEKKGMVLKVGYPEGKQTVTGTAYTADLNNGFINLFNRRLAK